ncbi:MAG: flagellar hook-associated protein FlgK [Rhodocyclaceae bacterium]|nr:flagellar hook-associated protein FlgK [Rhodocyclaceae bacterium]
MGSSLINIGTSGISAAMAGLTTAGQNISNAATPGYTRQQVIQQASDPLQASGGFLGQGARIGSVQRVYSQFLSNQLATAQSRQSELDAYSTQVNQLDNLLSDSTAGLTPALQGFFTGVQGLAANPGSNPSSTSSRQALLSDAQTLASRFNSLGQSLSGIRDNVNSQITIAASSISSYAAQIATMNQHITAVEAGGAGQIANDLRDQRDLLVAKLGQQVGVTTSQDSGGNLNVFIGNGVSLVSGTQAFKVSTAPSASDPNSLTISLEGARGLNYSIPENQLTGGAIGGLLSFRDQALNPAQAQLGQVAVGLALSFNTQHELGQDLNGNIGQAFFKNPTIEVQSNAGNSPLTPSGVISASFDATNVSSLTTSDYRVIYDGSSYGVTRVSDGKVVGVLDGSTTSLSVDGLTFSYDSTKSAQAGDSFLIQPMRQAAGNMSVAIADANMIAAAAPTRTSANIGNSGSGQISIGTTHSTSNLSQLFPVSPAQIGMTYDGSNLSFSNLPATAAIQVTHNGGVTQYAAGSVPALVPYVPGDTIALAPGFSASTASAGDFSFQINGQPAVGDKFYASLNGAASSDNRNALALGKLQTTNILQNSKSSYQSVYSQMVGLVGARAQDTSVNLSAQQTMVSQIQTSQQSVSGVNLDEEAANLIRYQQAYQAAGKLIQVAQTLFNQMLNA